jgi:putative NIF3 family GTP cyclohydrolase 1 type 2
MSEAAAKFPVIREAVASFPDRTHFRRAVAALLAGGYERSDVSVLASHEALDAADEKSTWLVAAGLTDEVNYIAPLTVAGIILVSGGPIAATLGAIVAAGLSGAALKEVFDRWTAAPHREDFEAALKAGAALLWVRCADPELELHATRILEEAGGRHVHVHARALQPDEAA